MDRFLGSVNDLWDYLLVVLVYAGLFVVIRQIYPRLEPDYRKTFWVLYGAYAVGVFIANYLLHLADAMSFLPWLNNFGHTFLWIGLCLMYLYGASYRRPFWEQYVTFAVLSYVVKLTEHYLLGTWEHDHFFPIDGNGAYILGWSLVDGLTPLLSLIGLRLGSRWVSGVIVPEFSLFRSSVGRVS